MTAEVRLVNRRNWNIQPCWPVVVVGVLFGWIGHCTHLLPLRVIPPWVTFPDHDDCLIRSTTIQFPMAGHSRLERPKLISPSGCCRVCAQIGILTLSEVINQLMVCLRETGGKGIPLVCQYRCPCGRLLVVVLHLMIDEATVFLQKSWFHSDVWTV